MNKHLFTKDINLQELINKLEIGEDGIYLAPYDEYGDKAYKSTHFGLSSLLTFAFNLLNSELEEEYLQISFNDFYNYVENAKEILTDMKYIEGDRLIQNNYNLTIYQNPKNYSVIELNSILPITEEQLQRSYMVPKIHVINDHFITEQEAIQCINPEKILTPREKEAFYGKKARQCLGLLPNKQKKKRKI